MQNNPACDVLVYNGTVVTVNPAYDVFKDGFICVAEGRIQSVGAKGPKQPLPDAQQTVDARGGIILPGLVNTHTHAPMALFRGLADDLPLMTWLNEYIFKAESRWLNPETVYTATLLSCSEMLLSGTTTLCDGYFFEDSVAQAVQASGMRAILGQGIIDLPAPGVPEPAQNVAEALRFIKKWQGRSAMIRPSLFCHSPYMCSQETLRQARRVADETASLFQIHVAETQGEAEQIQKEHGLSPVQYLDAIGILTPRTLVVHGIWVDKGDIACLARRNVGISVTTESHMKLASGVAPVPAFLEEGLAVGFGTDSCASNNNLDMFQEMDLAAKLHKLRLLDPTVLDARQVLRLATGGGSRAIGLGDEIGSIEVGKKADIIIVDTHKPHLTPLYDPTSHLVYAASGGDVTDVIIDGRVVVKDRTVLTVDVQAVMDEMEHLARQVAS